MWIPRAVRSLGENMWASPDSIWVCNILSLGNIWAWAPERKGTTAFTSSPSLVAGRMVQGSRWQVFDKQNHLGSLEERDLWGKEQQDWALSAAQGVLISLHSLPTIVPDYDFSLLSISHPCVNPSNLGQYDCTVFANFPFRAMRRQLPTASW